LKTPLGTEDVFGHPFVLKPEFALLIHLSESVRSFCSWRNIPGSEITLFFCFCFYVHKLACLSDCLQFEALFVGLSLFDGLLQLKVACLLSSKLASLQIHSSRVCSYWNLLGIL